MRAVTELLSLASLHAAVADIITEYEPVGDVEPCEGPCEGLCALALKQSQPTVGAYLPQCTDAGEYEPLQCSGSTGYCWCVDNGGNKISPEARSWEQGARTAEECAAMRRQDHEMEIDPLPPPPPLPTQLEQQDEAEDGPCRSVPRTSFVIVGAPVLQCDEHHQYLPRQCSGSTGYCWCVDLEGNKLAGTEQRRWEGISDESCREARAAVHPTTELATVELDGSPVEELSLEEPTQPDQQPESEHQSEQEREETRASASVSTEQEDEGKPAKGEPEEQESSTVIAFDSLVETGLFVIVIISTGACMWCQWTGARGRDLTGKKFPLTEMDPSTMTWSVPKQEFRDECDTRGNISRVENESYIPVVVVQDNVV